MSTPRGVQAGVPQGSVLSLILYSINDTRQTPTVFLGLFDRKEGFVLRKLQRDLSVIETRSEL
jgi:hypothetical protein